MTKPAFGRVERDKVRKRMQCHHPSNATSNDNRRPGRAASRSRAREDWPGTRGAGLFANHAWCSTAVENLPLICFGVCNMHVGACARRIYRERSRSPSLGFEMPWKNFSPTAFADIKPAVLSQCVPCYHNVLRMMNTSESVRAVYAGGHVPACMLLCDVAVCDGTMSAV